MTRRDWIGSFPVTAGILASALRGDNVISYREYARCLPDYLRSLASEAYERRVAALKKLATAEDIRTRQEWARDVFWKLAGGRLERTPLNLQTTGLLEREHYSIEKIVYESRPGEWIPANVYIPKTGTPPFPGVLFQMGHSANGKAADSYQRCCQGLVQIGFMVLAFDPMGQGERTNYPGPGGLTRLPSIDDEHTVPGRQALLVGDTATRMQVWDAVRSLDVLASHAHVDPRRLAATGQSGGGTLTMMLCAVDDRLAAAAVSSGNTENFACADFHPPGSVDDAEQNFIGSGPEGFDRWDLLWPFAPKPLLILTSAKDSFGTYSPSYEANGIEEYERLKVAYGMLQQPDRVRRVESPLPHGLAYNLRLEIYRWLVRWLQNGRTIIEEPAVSPEPARNLWATKTGSVVRDLGGRTPFNAYQSRAREIKTPAAAPDLRRLLGMAPTIGNSKLGVLGKAVSGDCDILAAEVPSGPNVWAPAWIFLPKKYVTRILIILDPAGRNHHWEEGQLYQRLAAAGSVVCVPDLRGIGDLRPEYSRGAPSYTGEHESEESYAWASLILGHTLLGQRVTDLLAMVEGLTAQSGWGNTVAVTARGQLTVPALCAGFLSSKIASLHLEGHLVSWRSILETESYSHPFANFVPDVLRETDLPELAAAMQPRAITLSNVVDAGGAPVPEERAGALYPSAKIITGPASIGMWMPEHYS